MNDRITGQDWFQDKGLQALMSALNRDGGEVRIVGGAVRNALLGEPVNDIDLATTHVPTETIRLATLAGFKPVPTGIEHGTITVVVHGTPFEVTSLRQDVETDGRHAKVVFGTDWKADALRRDFTINALYATADGSIIDDVDGLADIASRTLRFIGEAEQRIREDYLRILRFFRFFAWYGSGRPETEGLKASARLKDGLLHLSAERVWSELKKLLSARDPGRALLWMRQSGVLSLILPESEKWGIDAIPALIRAEQDLGWAIDPLLRLQAIIPPDPARMPALAERLRMSNGERDRLIAWATAEPVKSELSPLALQKIIYRTGQNAVIDRLKLAYAAARGEAMTDSDALLRAGKFSQLYDVASRFAVPKLPVSGQDLMDRGFVKGPDIGTALRKLETRWIESGFSLDADALLANLDQNLPDL